MLYSTQLTKTTYDGRFPGFILYWTGLLKKTNNVNKNIKYNEYWLI